MLENTIPYLYGLPIRKSFEGGDFPLGFLLILAYYKLGMLTEAYESAQSLLSSTHSDASAKEKIRYYRCIGDYIGARKDGRSEEDIKAILSKLYPPDILNRVMIHLKDPSKVFDHFYPRIVCWNCGSCPIQKDCDYPYVEKIHRKLKERYRDNPLDQMDNRKLFEKIAFFTNMD